MQLMAERGREYQVTPGLGWISGEVDRIAPSDPNLKIPHMGWNTLNMLTDHPVAERYPARTGRSARIFRALLSIENSTRRRPDRAGRLRRTRYSHRRSRQHGRHTISSGKKPATWPRADCKFFEVEAVILFPAIDLKEGLAVRLEQGDMARATVFHRDPAAQARAFEQQGFEYLHIVDLDGAFAGKPMNGCRRRSDPRDGQYPRATGRWNPRYRDRRNWLEKGVARVIIGTAAVRDPPFVKQAARDYPGRSRWDSMRATEKWRSRAGPKPPNCRRSILHVVLKTSACRPSSTPISRATACCRDLNLDATIALAEAISIPVIASGGLASIEDIQSAA